MNLGDFSSVVQLGVGLHLGTAVVQSVAEFASTPLLRRIERLKLLAEAKAKRDVNYSNRVDQACNLLGDLEVKRVQFFNMYKEVVLANGGIAICLCFLLVMSAFATECDIPVWAGLLIVFFSFGPASFSLLFLQNRWVANTGDLRRDVEKLEELLLD